MNEVLGEHRPHLLRNIIPSTPPPPPPPPRGFISVTLGSVSPMADVLKKLKYSVDKESLEIIYLILLDLNWNMAVIFGITVTKEIRKNWRIFNWV